MLLKKRDKDRRGRRVKTIRREKGEDSKGWGRTAKGKGRQQREESEDNIKSMMGQQKDERVQKREERHSPES